MGHPLFEFMWRDANYAFKRRFHDEYYMQIYRLMEWCYENEPEIYNTKGEDLATSILRIIEKYRNKE